MSVSNLSTYKNRRVYTRSILYRKNNNNKFRMNKYDERYRITIIAITIANLVNRCHCEQTIFIIIITNTL